MQAVLRLVEDDIGECFHDVVRDLLAAIGGQAVHDDGALVGDGEQVAVDLVRRENLLALLVLRLCALCVTPSSGA